MAGLELGSRESCRQRAHLTNQGLLLCLEGAATYAAYKGALADGRVGKDERVVLFNCGSGLKSEMPKVTRRLDRHSEIDYASL